MVLSLLNLGTYLSNTNLLKTATLYSVTFLETVKLLNLHNFDNTKLF